MMTMRFLGFILLLGALSLAGCRAAESNHNATVPTSPSPAAGAAEVKAKIDICNLLSSDDLKEVQGEAYTEAQRSDRLEGEVIVAQCYYALPTTVNSVVINVTTAKDEARSLRGLWEQRFGVGEEKAAAGKEEGERERAKESRERKETKAQAPRERGNEEEEKEAKPQRVQDLGDQA